MNIFSDLFGIFRQRGLVNKIKEGRSLVGFTISAVLVSIFGSFLYGFSMGIGLGVHTAIRDAVKVSVISFLLLLFSIPVFWLAFRLLGREERLMQVAAIPLTFVSTVSIILAATAPIVFFLSILVGFNPGAIYIHIVIVDLAILVGLYLTGTLLYYGFADQKRIVIPSVVSFLLLGVLMIVLLLFFSPFLAIKPTFSVGTDRLMAGLGVGVSDKANQALVAVTAADRISYLYQEVNENGDLIRDYAITKVGEDYYIQVHRHTVPDEEHQIDRRIWVIDSRIFNDFSDGKVNLVPYEDVSSYLGPALPQSVFILPPDFISASWRAYETGRVYTAT
ncbi:hypothetical protein KA005_17075, partial [bacterium]|nr:hypothetical protein [bacterium]